MSAQQGQQLLGRCLSQSVQFLRDDLYGNEIKDFCKQIIAWIQEQLRTISYQLSSINLNPRYIYHVLNNFYFVEGMY